MVVLLHLLFLVVVRMRFLDSSSVVTSIGGTFESRREGELLIVQKYILQGIM